jgi:two-component system, LytTR family, response regulator
MIRVLVVDDEPLARAGVQSRLSAHRDLIWVGEAGDGEGAVRAMQRLQPDLVFMDVHMPGMSGIDALRLVAREKRPLVVLLTAYEQYAVCGFELQALDYLLKPIDDGRFCEALDRARAAVRHRARNGAREPVIAWAERFTVRIGARVVVVDAADVDWIEAQDDYAGLRVGAQTYLLREPLHRLNQRLDPRRFVRIHRSAIVALDRIAELEPLPNRDCLLRLKDGTPLRASRTYIDQLRIALSA